MLLDANLLLFAVYEESPFHDRAREWLTAQLNGERRIAIPWQSLAAFMRLATQLRLWPAPLDPGSACEYVEAWLENELVWVPHPGPDHAPIAMGLIRRYQLRGNLIPDAHLAALAIEHGLELCSADTDFARFTEIRWHNPLAAG
jgi:toxin-antitoxin system PIN domain toxin